jgi:hypothetical protein
MKSEKQQVDEKHADYAIFKEAGFLVAVGLSCSVIIIFGLVIWYAQP